MLELWGTDWKDEEDMIALAYGFGLESLWIREMLRKEGITPFLIVCKGPGDHTPKPINIMLKGENFKVLRGTGFHEKWDIREDVNPHRFSCNVYGNTIIEWAKQRSSRPFDILYLGRRLQDLKEDGTFKNFSDFVLRPPTEVDGFTLKFPLWDWRRVEDLLLPPVLEPVLT